MSIELDGNGNGYMYFEFGYILRVVTQNEIIFFLLLYPAEKCQNF